MSLKLINPQTLGSPRGYSNGILVDNLGQLLFIAGQIGWDQDQKLVSRDFVEQFDRSLANVIEVVTAARGTADQIVRLVIYVTDIREYRARTGEVGECYRARMGKHFPAMVLVEVKSLLEDGALVEIEAMAVL
jgi:enamine deaminase RidA (YjgF/YER057c/UK114 family)